MIVDCIDHNPNKDTLASRYQCMSYPLSDCILPKVQSCLLPGKTTFMFSGSWRLNLDATYLELRAFRDSGLSWHHNTVFVEPEQSAMYHYTLTKLKSKNIVILHSDYWVSHRPVNIVVSDLDSLLQYADKVICTVPIQHTNFNKLTTSAHDLCATTGAVVVDDSFVFVRT